MVEILGTRVDDVDMEESLAKVASFVASGRERMDQVVTINPEGLWQAYQDKAFAAIINQASLGNAGRYGCSLGRPEDGTSYERPGYRDRSFASDLPTCGKMRLAHLPFGCETRRGKTGWKKITGKGIPA